MLVRCWQWKWRLKKGPPGPKAMEKAWVQEGLFEPSFLLVLSSKENNSYLWCFFSLHFYLCTVAMENGLFWQCVSPQFIWRCVRCREKIFLVMWQLPIFLAMCLFGDMTRVRFWRCDPSPRKARGSTSRLDLERKAQKFANFQKNRQKIRKKMYFFMHIFHHCPYLSTKIFFVKFN